MRAFILAALVFLTGVSHGEVTHVPIRTGVVLTPNQAYTITIQASAPAEIGWQTVQAKHCSTNCVQATDLTGPMHGTLATNLGASREYIPAAGKISVEYKNLSSEPVTIDIFRVHRTCDAEACKFLDKDAKGRWLVFKIAAFKAITTSKDGSYSVISGTAMSGRPFTIRAVWWTDDNKAFRFSCPKFIQRYLDNHTPAESYRPYILSGQASGDGNNIVLRSIDDCVPNAPHFGVPDANVFK